MLDADHKNPEAQQSAPMWSEWTKDRLLQKEKPDDPEEFNAKYYAEDSAFYLYEHHSKHYFKANGKYPAGSWVSIYGTYKLKDAVGWKPPFGGMNMNNGEIELS